MMKGFLEELTNLRFCADESQTWGYSEEDEVKVMFSMDSELPLSWVNKHFLNFFSSEVEAPHEIGRSSIRNTAQ